MKNIVKLLIGCASVAAIVLPAAAQSGSGISLSISPASQNVGLFGLTSYNLNISGLKGSSDYNGPALGAFDVVLDYNPTIATPVSATFGTMLNVDANGDFQSSDLGVATPGQIFLGDLSFGTVAALEAAQGKNFTLGTFTLEGVGLGTTLLTVDLPQTSLSDENGYSLDLVSTSGASLTVVPEPGLGGLAALVLGICGLRRKLSGIFKS